MHGRGVTAYTEDDQRESRGADDLSITTVSPGLNKTAWGSQLTSEPTLYVGTSRLCELSRPETILNNMGSYYIYLPVMRPDFVYTCLAQIFKELRLRLWLLQVEVCNRKSKRPRSSSSLLLHVIKLYRV